MDRFDYIIVGAGTAGRVLANRLSKDPNTVPLLEAGKKDNYFGLIFPWVISTPSATRVPTGVLRPNPKPA